MSPVFLIPESNKFRFAEKSAVVESIDGSSASSGFNA